MHDLIDSNHIQIRGVNDQGNNFVAPPSENLQIFSKPMPNHNISFVKASETKKNDEMNVDTDNDNMDIDEQSPMDNMVGLS